MWSRLKILRASFLLPFLGFAFPQPSRSAVIWIYNFFKRNFLQGRRSQSYPNGRGISQEIGKVAVGISNARYATSGKSSIQHLHGGKQPLILGKKRGRKIAISYNGNLVNVKQLRSKLTEKFGKFTTDADTEVLGRQLLLGLEEYRGDFSRAVGLIMDEVEGAYSTLVIDEEGSLYAFRDVHGIRPFCFGKRGSLYAFASETPALEINNILSFDYVRPGELISVVTRLERKVLRRGKRNAICA